jgi:GTP-binding protein
MSKKAPPIFPPAPESDAPFAGVPVQFVGSFTDATRQLEPPLPEVAVLGRSNVGKSSLLNALFGRPLARVSRTPGRTAQVNVFRLPGLYLLDLPGYGYARVSAAEHRRYDRLVRNLVERRRSLAGVLWLLDLRHDPSAGDLTYGERLATSGVPVLVAATKADKLPYARRQSRLRALRARLALPDEQVQLTSSLSGLGIAELGASLQALGSPDGWEDTA